MRKLTPASVAMAILSLWLIFGGGISLPWSPFAPAPFKTDKLRVLIVEETAERGSYTAGQNEAMRALAGPGSVREYVEKKGGEFYLLDEGVEGSLDKAAPWVQEAVKVERTSRPWIVAATPSTGFSQALPKDAIETVSALKKIGGE